MSENDLAEASDFSEASQDDRANRWNGNPSTWENYTADECGLAASLDQIRNSDLSVHLYNAYALKRRAQEYAEDPKLARVNEEHHAIPEADRTFKPPKYWSAWPLPPEDVPRKHETFGADDTNDSYTLRKEQIPWPSREMEEVLMEITLRHAKLRFNKRKNKFADDSSAMISQEADNSEMGSVKREPAVVIESEIERATDRPDNQTGPYYTPNEFLKPAISLDDESSFQLLRPPVRHTLSKLDDLLTALHHTRAACRRYSHSDANATRNQDVTITVNNDSDSNVNGVDRSPGDHFSIPVRSRVNEHISMQSDQEPVHRKTARRGRPRKTYERLDGENERDYAVRIARLRKKQLPTFAKSPTAQKSRSSSHARTSKSKSPGQRASPEGRETSRLKRLAIRDWSEVLGAAGLLGFAPEVLARATQRCATLFGEGMTMRTMPEGPLTRTESETVATYLPGIGPDLSAMDSLANSEFEAETSTSSSCSETKAPDKVKVRRTATGGARVTSFCPIAGCPRKVQGFRDTLSLRRHLTKGHKVSAGDVDDYILSSDEEMDGAIHVDGFLKPIRPREWRRRGTIPQRRHKTDGSAGPDGSSSEGSEAVDSASNGSRSDLSLSA